MSTVYLAGPGVFRPDALAWGATLQSLCQQHGISGLYPLDQCAPAQLSGAAQAQWIFHANCELIRQADAVLADVRAFRSQSEPDSGTAFEIGFAHAIGKPVYLWLPDVDRTATQISRVGGVRDAQGCHVEDFGAPLNLMLWQAATQVIYSPDAESAIAELGQHLLNQKN